MDLEPLPFRSSLDRYQKQAADLLDAYRSGESYAIRFLHETHPLFLGSEVSSLMNRSDSDAGNPAVDLADAQHAIARWYDFESWPALADYVEAVGREHSPICQFETAAEAVITGDVAALKSLLRNDPELVRARSMRVTRLDPPVHRATLLHYVAANGVEGYRQKSPKSAVEIATVLLEAGADVDALADMYGTRCTTLSLLVSSVHPAKAGVQVALVETLLDWGAAIEGSGTGPSPLMTALAFGYRGAAETLARRGARTDNVAAAAGLGRLGDARRLLAPADSDSRHRALALAAQHGHADVVRLLLDAGEDPSRYNPQGNNPHATPLHQAVLAGHDAVVRLLVERGARLDVRDTVYQSTPLGWAMYGGQGEIENHLRAHGAT